MKKLIFLIPVLFLISGCTSYIEINNIKIVKSITIDYKDDLYIVKLNIIDNKDIISKSNNLSNALNNAYQKDSKKLYLQHVDLVILTSDLINYKLKDTINFFINNTSLRNNFNLALIDNIDINTNNINSLIINGERTSGITKSINFEKFIKDIYENNKTYIPYLKDNENIDGIYLIKNYKLYSKLNKNESIIYNLVNNNINTSYINNINIDNNQTTITKTKNKVKIYIKSSITNDQDKYNKYIKKEIFKLNKKYSDYDLFNFGKRKIYISVKGDNKNEEN